MKRTLDLADIQGNIVVPYGRFGFPVMRHFFFNIGNAAAGRKFVEEVRQAVTTAERWRSSDDTNTMGPERPLVATNIGFSFYGLLALELPTDTLREMPGEFIDGMAARANILGDIGPSAPDRWDEIWRKAVDKKVDSDAYVVTRVKERQIHIWISLTAQIKPDGTPVDELAARTMWLKQVAAESGGVSLLSGHKGPNADYQDSSARMKTLPSGETIPTPKEHFGFSDGIGDPTFVGQYDGADEKEYSIGNGKIRPGHKTWSPLATGEFILGHASESQELPPTAMPWSFTRNGTFMAYRKLHQNIAKFSDYVGQQASIFQKVTASASFEAAKETLLAKMIGRWSNGFPIAIAPTYDEFVSLTEKWGDIPALQLKRKSERTEQDKARLDAYQRLISDFRYNNDADGTKCPLSAHIRRTNPRDALDPLLHDKTHIADTMLSNRRRIMRRGLPYGEHIQDDASEHGVIFNVLCGSLFRQFEFIQQQWVNYSASFGAGNDTDPLTGIRTGDAKFVIPGDGTKNGTPFICANIPAFVETRGGEYFFLPSLTALREIAEGSVDPT